MCWINEGACRDLSAARNPANMEMNIHDTLVNCTKYIVERWEGEEGAGSLLVVYNTVRA